MLDEANWSGVVIWMTFVIAPIMLVQNFIYWYRRKLFPISGRFPGLSLFGSLVCLIKISLLGYSSSLSSPLPCWLLAFDFRYIFVSISQVDQILCLVHPIHLLFLQHSMHRCFWGNESKLSCSIVFLRVFSSSPIWCEPCLSAKHTTCRWRSGLCRSFV